MSAARILRPLLSRHGLHLQRTQTKTIITQTTLRHSSWSPSPAPPRLPKEEQDLFETLQQRSTGAFSTPTPVSVSETNAEPLGSDQQEDSQTLDVRVEATGQGQELHPDIRRGSKDEFDGDRNPLTGEVGGPKREPLRWGHAGDWSYNGRVTDF